MRPLRWLTVPVLLLAAACLYAQPPQIRGITLGLLHADREHPYEPLVGEIAATGASHVSLLFPLRQHDAEATMVEWRGRGTPSPENLRRTINIVHDHGMQTMLFPIVLLDRPGQDDWRGSLRPRSRALWFESYAGTLRRIATLAAEEDVHILSIGSEFSTLQEYTDEWRNVAAVIREVYPGKLVYTTNWDTTDRPMAWEAVDYFGVSGYYELSLTPGDLPSTTTLTAQWLKHKRQLLADHARLGAERPIIFCEVGYPSVRGGTAWPWDYTRTAEPDNEEQRRGFESFIRAWDGDPRLNGVFVYTWHEFNQWRERDHSIRGKPAAGLIRAWYQPQ